MWLFNSSVGRKFVMGITGAALALFLLFHATMNIVVIVSPSGYNAICAFLGANWYAIVGTLGLAALALIHIIYAFVLTIMNYRARGSVRYAVTDRQEQVEWSSKNMLVLGFVILAGLCLHLYNFWFKMQFAEITGIETGAFDPHNGAAYVQELFANPVYCVVYLVWLLGLWFHLSHGIWSSMHSIGWSNNKWLVRIKWIGKILATLIVLMFASVVVYYFVYNICGGADVVETGKAVSLLF